MRATVPTPVRDRIAAIAGVAAIEDLDGDTIRVHTNADGAAGAVLKVLVDNGITGISTGRPIAGRGLPAGDRLAGD